MNPIRIATIRADLAPRELKRAELDQVDTLLVQYAPDGDTRNRMAHRVTGSEESEEAHRSVLEVMRQLASSLYLNPELTVIVNLGGGDPRRAARDIGEVLSDAGSSDLLISAVLPGNRHDEIEELLLFGEALAQEQTGAPLTTLKRRILAMHSLTGAAPLVASLSRGARVTVASVADTPSVAIAAAGAAHRWKWNNYNALAGAAVAGQHIASAAAEQGAVLYAADVATDGAATILLPNETDAPTDQIATQIEAELKESPTDLYDVTIDASRAVISPHAGALATISGVRGTAPAPTTGMQIVYEDGRQVEAQLTITLPDEQTRQELPESLNRFLHAAGWENSGTQVRCYLEQDNARANATKQPMMLQISAVVEDEPSAARFGSSLREFAATADGAEFDGQLTLNSRPNYGLWPTTAAKELLDWDLDVRSANEWVE